MIPGRPTVGAAGGLRKGGFYRYREPLRSPLLRSRVARLPFVRGVVVLWESVSYGMRMLVRSADVQRGGEQPLGAGGNALVLGIALAAALVLFIGVPYAATSLARGVTSSSLLLNIAEGLIRLALLIGYLVAISFMPDIRRVFAYHGAEHMTIHAFENGDPLVPERIAPDPTAPPRCGTAFLLFVALLAVILFAFIPRQSPVFDVLVRLALAVPVPAISYEVLRLRAERHRPPGMRPFLPPGLLLPAVNPRPPHGRVIRVADAPPQGTLAGDREAEG